MPFIRCATPSEAAAQWQAVLDKGQTAAFLVFAGPDPVTGQAWCPDCVVADPVIRRAIASNRPDLTVYECVVAQRSEWKGHMDHPYRIHPGLRIARIPTLVLLANGREMGRLVEGDAANPQVVTAFLTP